MREPILIGLMIAVGGLLSCTSAEEEEWTHLLDESLSHWSTYLGIPNPDTPIQNLPKDAEGKYISPIGHGKDERGVFTVESTDGEMVLRITGEIYGSLYTLKEYENYHLSLQYKWGSKKWEPRLNLELDSGLMYHGTGNHGVDYWKAWPVSQELQIMENATGDWWTIADSRVDIRCAKVEGTDELRYNIKAEAVAFGPTGVDISCSGSRNLERASGEWNSVELITYGDKSLHIVNGEVVMALNNSRYSMAEKEIPLTRGKILLQSEAGEVFFKAIKIKSISGIPNEYAQHFN